MGSEHRKVPSSVSSGEASPAPSSPPQKSPAGGAGILGGIRHPAEYVRGSNSYPQFPPDGWAIIQEWGDGWALRHRHGLRVIVDVRFVNDVPWLHVSYSRASRLPNWEDTKLVKSDFVGDNVAINVLPRSDDYVNIHQFCLHLWHRIDGDTCPNFTADLDGVRSI